VSERDRGIIRNKITDIITEVHTLPHFILQLNQRNTNYYVLMNVKFTCAEMRVCLHHVGLCVCVYVFNMQKFAFT